ncbi:YggS family pyridoxal phosphate-dependent enzyme [Treponema sp. C6A8]|uniref:YggS family pyridoxal phosphate-dependent enzyme n=1 Tax=Treponema sp. C6A8 TaxID=1410609 RepID=UPI00048081C4|nr:YggS family pyridoxal phosphate-dependent enzyme [Treponema sp. C6A8]
MSVNIAANLKLINDKIRDAEKRAGRPEGSVKLMAVSKFHPSEDVLSAIEAGQFLFGENRVQEAFEKFPPIIEAHPDTELHMIGVLQSNKVKNAVKVGSCIESVDRLSLLDEIEKQCAKIDKKIKVLFEFHTGEESKSGFESQEELEEALTAIKDGKYPHVIPSGFMTMAPFTEDKNRVRKSFVMLRELAQRMKEKYPDFEMNELSMGMSGDFEIAIEEGSTLVRVGTAIFGERDYSK